MRLMIAVWALLCPIPAFCQLRQVETMPGKARGRVLGKVTTVLDGNCTGTRFYKVPEDAFLYAFGGAALQPDAVRQGEGLIVDGRLYIKSLDSACGYCTRTAPEGAHSSGWCGFLAGVDAAATPVARYRLEGTSSTVEELFTHLAAQHGPLFGVAGAGGFTALETSAIRKAPVYGEPILGPKKSDYFHPKAILTDVDALFFGLVLRSVSDETSATKTVFYVNPDDRGTTGMQSHTHFATVSSADGIDPAKPETALGKIQEVAHLLTQSRLTSLELVVYKLDELEMIETK